jgi:chromosome segregation ATPase
LAEVAVNELEAVKRKIDKVEQEIDNVNARVEELEERKRKEGLGEEDKKELEQKRGIYDKLLAKEVELRKKEARLEERQQGTAGTFSFLFFLQRFPRFCFFP